MLEAVPKSMLSRDYIVSENGVFITEIHFAWFREEGEMLIEGVAYKAYREGITGGAFLFERDGTVLARCEKPCTWTRILLIEYNARHYTLKPASMWGHGFAALLDEQEIGTIKPKGIGSRKAIVNFAVELPLTLQLFMLWLVLIFWKRDEAAAATH